MSLGGSYGLRSTEGSGEVPGCPGVNPTTKWDCGGADGMDTPIERVPSKALE